MQLKRMEAVISAGNLPGSEYRDHQRCYRRRQHCVSYNSKRQSSKSQTTEAHTVCCRFLYVVLLATTILLPQARGDDAGTSKQSYPSKALIWPAEFSHWINLKILANNLVRRGTEVTVLRSSAYEDFMDETEEFNFINFNVSGFKPGDHLKSMDDVLHLIKLGDGKSSLLQTAMGMVRFWWEQLDMRDRQCNAIMTNEKILNRLDAAHYNVVIADASVPCGEIIAAKLVVPLVYSVRILPAEEQFQLSQTPTPISYVPMINTEFTDRMTFLQRTANALTYLYQTIGVELYTRVFMDPLVQRYLGKGAGYKQLMTKASLWLIRTDFAFEYPRPLMPNVKFIGGFHCKPAKPLQQDLEDFVTGSEAGFIVFSMGSMVRNMHKSKANLIAAAFGKLKQRVVWRYLGERPDTLGNNTRLMSWLPQNDLLGHRRCKLFITHGGTNGIYEAIYHGVPMLGLPLLVDQFDNMIRIEGRGAGKRLDITNLDENEMRHTIEHMITNTSYKENALRLTALHRDKAMTPLESATYWIEYVIRHKGAPHLRPASHELWWFQYHLLDVIAFLSAIIIGTIWCAVKVVRAFKRRKGGKRRGSHENEGAVTNGEGGHLQQRIANGHDHMHAGANGFLRRRKTDLRPDDSANGNGHIPNGVSKAGICKYCSRGNT